VGADHLGDVEIRGRKYPCLSSGIEFNFKIHVIIRGKKSHKRRFWVSGPTGADGVRNEIRVSELAYNPSNSTGIFTGD